MSLNLDSVEAEEMLTGYPRHRFSQRNFRQDSEPMQSKI